MVITRWIKRLLKIKYRDGYSDGHRAGWVTGSEYTRRICHKSLLRPSLN